MSHHRKHRHGYSIQRFLRGAGTLLVAKDGFDRKSIKRYTSKRRRGDDIDHIKEGMEDAVPEPIRELDATVFINWKGWAEQRFGTGEQWPVEEDRLSIQLLDSVADSVMPVNVGLECVYDAPGDEPSITDRYRIQIEFGDNDMAGPISVGSVVGDVIAALYSTLQKWANTVDTKYSEYIRSTLTAVPPHVQSFLTQPHVVLKLPVEWHHDSLGYFWSSMFIDYRTGNRGITGSYYDVDVDTGKRRPKADQEAEIEAFCSNNEQPYEEKEKPSVGSKR